MRIRVAAKDNAMYNNIIILYTRCIIIIIIMHGIVLRIYAHAHVSAACGESSGPKLPRCQGEEKIKL